VGESEGRTLSVPVVDGPRQNKEGLYHLITDDEGNLLPNTRISFPQGNLYRKENFWSNQKIDGEAYFYDGTQFGNKRVDRIQVLK
jgi:hypothetical protein